VNRRRRILDGATEAFYERGFHGVGVDEIARRAELRGPSIYRHFSSKDEILATLMNEAMDELAGAAARVGADPVADLDRAVRHHIDFAISQRHLVTIYQRDSSAMVEPWKSEFALRRADYSERWERLVRARFPNLTHGQATTASQACLGTIFSVASWPPRVAAAGHVRATLTDLVLGGLAAVGASEAR
jgi:AcrR family transcriptional regulator